MKLWRTETISGAAATVLISSCVFSLCVVLAGGVIRHIFFEQTSTFILEQLTSSTSTLLGQSVSRYDTPAVFLKGTALLFKLWLFFSALLFLLLRRRIEGFSFTRACIITASGVYPVFLIGGILALFVRGLGFFLPLYQGYLFYPALAGLFTVYVPVRLFRMLNGIFGEVPVFRLFFSYYSILALLVILWSVNHYNLSLLRMI